MLLSNIAKKEGNLKEYTKKTGKWNIKNWIVREINGIASKQNLSGGSHINSKACETFNCIIMAMSIAALQVNIIPLSVTINRKMKKPPVKLNFWHSQ